MKFKICTEKEFDERCEYEYEHDLMEDAMNTVEVIYDKFKCDGKQFIRVCVQLTTACQKETTAVKRMYRELYKHWAELQELFNNDVLNELNGADEMILEGIECGAPNQEYDCGSFGIDWFDGYDEPDEYYVYQTIRIPIAG